jgi:hypothetical protein
VRSREKNNKKVKEKLQDLYVFTFPNPLNADPPSLKTREGILCII